jgi:dTDP-L-rhamnose 4-epimerase
MATVLHKEDIVPQIAGKYRAGDIRHCFADITKARQLLEYQPNISLEEGLAELVGWLSSQRAVDQVEHANLELAQRGLTV